MKLAFTGSSGSGKTTLVHYVKESYNLKWLNGSSGDIKNEDQQTFLKARGMNVGNGHAEIIRAGHENPVVGVFNQDFILQARLDLIKSNDNFVTDRSPIDNIVYYIMQCGPYVTEKDTAEFIDKALQGLQELTHLIYIPAMLPQIEDNGSRIANTHYQSAVDAVFKMVLIKYMDQLAIGGPKLLVIDVVDLEERKKLVYNFLGTSNTI